MNQLDAKVPAPDQEAPAARWGAGHWASLVVLGIAAAIAVGMLTSALTAIGLLGLALCAAAALILAPYMAARTMIHQFPDGAPSTARAAITIGLINLVLAALAIAYIFATIEICMTGC